jgi:hypothetical protein
MRKIPFFVGVFLLLFPLNWARLYLLGEMPPGNNPALVLLLIFVFFVIAALLIWYGVPAVRKSYQAIVEGPGGISGPFVRLVAAVREAHEHSVQLRLEEQRQREMELERARSGTLTPIDPGTVVLHEGEEAFASIPATMLEMQTVGYRGRSTGVSVRVARGVWLRQSGSRGTPEKGMVPVAHGMLVATNRRLVFAGDQKSVAVPFEKMSSFEPMRDGLRFGNGRKTFNFLLGESRQQEIFSIIANRLVHERR